MNSPNFSLACETTGSKAAPCSLVQAAESRQPVGFNSVGPSKGRNSAIGTLVNERSEQKRCLKILFSS